MIVLDASVVLELLLRTPAHEAIARRLQSENGDLACPHLIDIEVLHVLRRLAHLKELREGLALEVIEDLAALGLRRYEHEPFRHRIWQLRHNFSAYDAAYVALAESLEAPLLTHDAKLAAATGHEAEIELI